MGGHILYAIFLVVICCAGIGAQLNNCTYYGNTSTVQNGYCDTENNNAECDFDGGDCCLCTCSHGSYYACGSNGFTCLDPNVTSVEPSLCVESSPSLITCPAGLRQEWVVENTTQARAFAQSVRCIGGSFNVTWKGTIIVDETISIFGGTVLNVMGGDTAVTAIVGDGKTRLFAVINASLHLRNIVVSNGNAIYGGAIVATSGSRLSFSRTVFSRNTASISGGGLYLTNGSTVTIGVDVVFLNNSASDGGAFYLTGGSTVSGKGEATFSQNAATSGNGGALYVTNGSSVVWIVTSHFLENAAQYDGGALFLSGQSKAFWNTASNFSANMAQRNGGALFIMDGSRAVWTAKSHFLSNNAGDDGGALYLWDRSNAIWNETSNLSNMATSDTGGSSKSSGDAFNPSSVFSANSARSTGGAVFAGMNSTMVWGNNTQFIRNTAERGGALFVTDGVRTEWRGESEFIANNATYIAGAVLFSEGSSAIWNAKSTFSGNSAQDGGGLYLWDGSTAIWTAASYIINNSAGNSGGALYLIQGSTAVWTAPSYFHGNSADVDGGAIYLWNNSEAIWNETSILSNMATSDTGGSSESRYTALSPYSVFSANSARSTGGAVFAGMDSTMFWDNNTQFIRNTAERGGALFVTDGVRTEWRGESEFIANNATYIAGAVLLSEGSSAIWNANSTFSGNSAQDGGGLYLWDGSTAIWTAASYFFNNSAVYSGGALYMIQGSTAAWTAPSYFHGNSADVDGGAIYLWNNSEAIWNETSIFSNMATSDTGGSSKSRYTALSPYSVFSANSARSTGGAVFAGMDSTMVWGNNTQFIINTAERGGALFVTDGVRTEWRGESEFIANNATYIAGAVLLSEGSSAIWNANSTFSGNSAQDGGGLYLWDGSTAIWTAASYFFNNSAVYSGGALYLIQGSTAAWTAPSYFHGNSADVDGGAIYLWNNSEAIWNETSILSNAATSDTGGSSESRYTALSPYSVFSANSARSDGGAVFAGMNSALLWGNNTQFIRNIAGRGGALFVTNGVRTEWRGESEFIANIATYTAGALFLSEGSSAIWNATSTFSSNNAQDNGGGLSLWDGSMALWTAFSYFFNNSAGKKGGALHLLQGCTAGWTAPSYFEGNSADKEGGAIYLWNKSEAIWNETSIFSKTATSHIGESLESGDIAMSLTSVFYANSARFDGGAVYAGFNSTLFGSHDAKFIMNTAERGGALFVTIGVRIKWRGESEFIANNAAKNGGALFLSEGSSSIWNAKSTFSDNNARDSGGGVFSWDRSAALWTAFSFFVNNSAENGGGALYLLQYSTAVWTAPSYFHGNSADVDGGAILLSNGSEATWNDTPILSNTAASGIEGPTESSDTASSSFSVFSTNSARSRGGAVFAAVDSTMLWASNASFINNTADNGGALFLTDGVRAEYRGNTEFISNYARDDGGAVGSTAFKSELSSTLYGDVSLVTGEESEIFIKGITKFVRNTCGGRGGALALVQSLAVSFDSKYTAFLQNAAVVSGGAVYLGGIGIGTQFRRVEFVENIAQVGGGVHATGSGITVTLSSFKQQEDNPTTFYECSFVDNFAFATGGGVDSASGQDVFYGTLFEGNQARVGGAMRLAGTASIKNCSFHDNISELGEGPAVHNLGYMSNLTNNYFRGNIFSCEPRMFLDFNKSDNIYTTVCNGCPGPCTECSFEDAQRGSPTCVSLALMGIEHTTSNGGATTLEQLIVDKGHWRATNTSTNVYECFNTKACGGGITSALEYCLLGYEGPYCSVCSNNYVSGASFSCQECSDPAVAITILVVLAVLASAVGIAIVSYLIYAEGATGERCITKIIYRVPTQSVKIIIVVWQILTQFTSVANVTFPNEYQRFLDGIDFLNFDLSWVFSVGCFLEVNFYDRLLLTTIAPVVVMGMLAVTYAVAVRRYHGSPEIIIQNFRQKHMSTALLVTFLVYSSVSSVVFQMFACDDLDDGKSYLRADYRLECDSPTHIALQVYAGLMVLLYPVGIPGLYAFLLFSNRNVLQDRQGREISSVVRSMSDLWKPYKPQRFYYEVIECGRRMMLTGVVVFIDPSTAAQIAVTLAIAVAFMIVSEVLAPHESYWDAWINRTGNIIIFSSMYVALLLKVDVSGENASSQKTFGVILIVTHGCMILAVVVEAVIMTMSLRTGRLTEDSMPRLRNSSSFKQRSHASLVDDNVNNELELIERSSLHQ